MLPRLGNQQDYWTDWGEYLPQGVVRPSLPGNRPDYWALWGAIGHFGARCRHWVCWEVVRPFGCAFGRAEPLREPSWRELAK